MRFFKGKPEVLTACVLSVHHSGTRTLVKHLGLDTHQHFIDSDSEIRAYYPGRGDLVHIPIRHPMSVAASWARKGKPVERLIGQYRSMFEYLEHNTPVLHRIESLPRLAGTDDPGEPDLARAEQYQARIASEVIRPHLDFFLRYYESPFSTDSSRTT